jgi:hypothetical protein
MHCGYAAAAFRRSRRRAFNTMIRSAVQSILRGFEEHGWSGKLFMIMTAGASLVSLLGWFAVFAIEFPNSHARIYVPLLFLFGVLPFVAFQLRLLLGIARFESWSRWLAMAGCIIGILTGLGSLAVIRGAQFWITSAAEVALSTQFLVYFVRIGDRFGRRPLLGESLAAPRLADAHLDPEEERLGP